MSKLKVGDRVAVVVGPYEGNRGVIVVDDDSQYSLRYIVRLDPPAPQTGDDSYTWATAKDLRRLVKRKRAKSPDRVMVAAQLMAGMLANPGGPIQADQQGGWRWTDCSLDGCVELVMSIADALIAEGAK